MADRHPGEDAVLDLVLGEDDEREREDVRVHLALCEACARERAELAEGARLVLAAAPAIPPPPGFEARVLAALSSARAASADDAERRSTPAEEPYRLRRGGLRFGWGAVAAAAAGLLVGVAGTAAVLDRSGSEPRSDSAADRAPSAAPAEVGALGPALLTADGARVGTVLESRFDGRPVLVLTITDGSAGMRYDCRLLLADGRREPAGSWVLPDAPGVTWVVAKPEGEDVAGVELVAASGRTWAAASLGAG